METCRFCTKQTVTKAGHVAQVSRYRTLDRWCRPQQIPWQQALSFSKHQWKMTLKASNGLFRLELIKEVSNYWPIHQLVQIEHVPNIGHMEI